MSAGNINDSLQIWASTLPCDQDTPSDRKQDMYDTIDRINKGDTPWQNFNVSFNGEIQEGDTTPWKHAKYDFWFCNPRIVLRNQLRNTNYVNELDFSPKEVCNEDGKHEYEDFMLGDWAWWQAVRVQGYLK